MSHYRVAAVQMVSTADVEPNLEAACRLVKQAAAEGAMLAVLPEAFACADATRAPELGRQERTAGGPLRSFLAGLARDCSVFLVGGTIPVADGVGSRFRAACFLYAPDGAELARYDKMHLFDVELPDEQQVYRESALVEPGERVVSAELPCGSLGLAVCYDLRFPELFRVLQQRGLDLLALPSAFTRHTGAAHWHVLLRARAIENQCFVIAPNQGGRQSARRESWGGSAIIDPWGRVLASAALGEAVLVADIDRELLAEVRRRLPVLAHRRLETPDSR